MLETIREYVLERLEDSGETAAIRARHARYYTALVDEVGLGYYTPGDADPSHLSFVVEQPNVRLALAWEAEQGETALLLRLMKVGWWDWLPSDAESWITRAIRGEARIPPGQRSLFLAAAGSFALLHGDLTAATAWTDESLDVAREPDDAVAIAMAVGVSSRIAERRGDLAKAELLAKEALSRWEGLDAAEWRWMGAAWWLGTILMNRGDAAGAEPLIARALEIARVTRAEWAVPKVMTTLADCMLVAGDRLRAASLFAESVAMIRDGWGIFDPIQTDGFFRETAAFCCHGLGAVAAMMGEADMAARLCGAAEALWEHCGVVERPAHAQDRVMAILAPARRKLGPEAFAAAWAVGRALSPQAACNEALAFAETMLPRSRPS
jgi:hypothetical protein